MCLQERVAEDKRRKRDEISAVEFLNEERRGKGDMIVFILAWCFSFFMLHSTSYALILLQKIFFLIN